MPAKSSALFLSAEPPYPMVGGGALRSASILEFLRQRYQVDVVCFEQPGHNAEPDRDLPGVRRWVPIRLPAHGRSGWQRGIRNIGRMARSVPPLLDRFSGFERELRDAIAGERYAVAVVEHFWCAGYAPVLRPQCERLVLDLHNVESLWHQRYAAQSGTLMAMMHRRFAEAARRLEQTLLSQFDLVIATSRAEVDAVAERLRNARFAVVPNTLPLLALPQVEVDHAVVFSGNMEYAPNRHAAKHFQREIWPLLKRRHPDLRWKLVGRHAGKLTKDLQPDPQLEFVTDPEDAMIEIAKAKLAVVPLRFGTGTRLKIVEAWAAGRPVVSTPVGAEGLGYTNEVDILLAEGNQEFADAVSRVLAETDLAENLGKAGRCTYEKAYCWPAAWNALASEGL